MQSTTYISGLPVHTVTSLDDAEEICPKCFSVIDPNLCWCGAAMGHSHPADHGGIPEGCNCGQHNFRPQRLLVTFIAQPFPRDIAALEGWVSPGQSIDQPDILTVEVKPKNWIERDGTAEVTWDEIALFVATHPEALTYLPPPETVEDLTDLFL
jgi:hypothetical protein